MNAEHSYTLLSGGGGRFGIHAPNGSLYVNASLTGLSQDSTFELRVKATDVIKPNEFDEATVFVEVTKPNDFAPKFTNLPDSITVTEDGVAPMNIFNATAIDKDITSPERNFSFSLCNFDGVFSINPDTGRITVLQVLDRESVAQYALCVRAIDKPVKLRRTGTATLTVNVGDLNDNDPKFDKSLYEARVNETFNIGDELLVVLATDRDFGSNSKLTYNITSGDDGFFELNSVSGSITLKKKLLQKVNDVHTLTVTAFDGGIPPRSGSTTVKVYVIEVNDNSPMFYDPDVVYLDENLPVGSLFYRINVSDADASDDPAGQFDVEVTKGTGIVGEVENQPLIFFMTSKQQLNYEVNS